MSDPHGMPSTDTILEVGRFGKIRIGGPCRDDYLRIVVDGRHAGGLVKLQAAAMDSFHDAEKALGFEIILTGSWRACADQAALYRKDSARYADPDKTGHTRGICVDVSTALGRWRLHKIEQALGARHWHRARTDEPWHWSFGCWV